MLLGSKALQKPNDINQLSRKGSTELNDRREKKLPHRATEDCLHQIRIAAGKVRADPCGQYKQQYVPLGKVRQVNHGHYIITSPRHTIKLSENKASNKNVFV